MTRDEIKALLYSINSNYPHVKTTPEEAKNRIDMWTMAFKGYDTATVVQAVKIHMLDPRVGMYYPTIAHVTANLQRAENLIAMTASTRARTAITAERAEMPHRDARALETYKLVSEEWDEADRANQTCRTGKPCPIENFKVYREGGKCELCPERPRELQGGA